MSNTTAQDTSTVPFSPLTTCEIWDRVRDYTERIGYTVRSAIETGRGLDDTDHRLMHEAALTALTYRDAARVRTRVVTEDKR